MLLLRNLGKVCSFSEAHWSLLVLSHRRQVSWLIKLASLCCHFQSSLFIKYDRLTEIFTGASSKYGISIVDLTILDRNSFTEVCNTCGFPEFLLEGNLAKFGLVIFWWRIFGDWWRSLPNEVCFELWMPAYFVHLLSKAHSRNISSLRFNWKSACKWW